MRCVCMHVCLFFYKNKVCHAEEHCDLSYLAHIYLFYSYTGVEFTWGHSEKLLLPVPSELCMRPEKMLFFLVDDLMGGEKKKYADYFQVQIPISKQYFILWLNQFYFSVFCLTIWALRSLCSFHPEFTAYAQGLSLPSQVGFPNQTHW